MPIFDIRLNGSSNDMLVFQTIRPGLKQAAAYADALLDAHEQFHGAEIWKEMECLKRIARRAPREEPPRAGRRRPPAGTDAA